MPLIKYKVYSLEEIQTFWYNKQIPNQFLLLRLFNFHKLKSFSSPNLNRIFYQQIQLR